MLTLVLFTTLNTKFESFLCNLTSSSFPLFLCVWTVDRFYFDGHVLWFGVFFGKIQKNYHLSKKIANCINLEFLFNVYVIRYWYLSYNINLFIFIGVGDWDLQATESCNQYSAWIVFLFVFVRLVYISSIKKNIRSADLLFSSLYFEYMKLLLTGYIYIYCIGFCMSFSLFLSKLLQFVNRSLPWRRVENKG